MENKEGAKPTVTDRIKEKFMKKKDAGEARTDVEEVRAVARYVRMSPRKLRLVIDEIRGKSVNEAKAFLQFSPKRAARTLEKVLNSAVANAENNFKKDGESLVVSRAFVDCGPTQRSWIPRARGRASAIHKRTSHITICVKEREAKG
jgi:large subunit ribosomal protein L22